MTQARKAESMASLRSQLPDLEAIEPISQVKHAFELKIPSRDPRLRDSVKFDLFSRRSSSHSCRPCSQTSKVYVAVKSKKQRHDDYDEDQFRKEVKEKNLPKPALRGSTRRMTKVEPRGISFNIFATCETRVIKLVKLIKLVK